MSAPTVIALDVGGTSIKGAVVTETGEFRRRASRPTPVADGPDAVVAGIRALAAELVEAGAVGVGIALPGVVDKGAGVARYAANLGWRDVPLGGLLGDDLGLPVVVEHDVRAAGLAECTLGAARGVPDCLVVVVGTGIAAAVVSAGRLLRGGRGVAGEIGHLPVRPDGDPCSCGQRGCTEVYASAAGLARRYAARTGRTLTARQIAAALPADADAAAVWRCGADALGVALTAATLVTDPSVIVLGGGLAEAGAALREPVTAALHARLAWRAAPRVVNSPLGARAGLHGAALLAWQAAGRPVPPG